MPNKSSQLEQRSELDSRIDSNQKPMDSHKKYFLILKALTFVSAVNPWLLGPPFELVKTACR